MKARGWRVFATCRQEADCSRLQAEGLESFVLDYSDESSIAAAVETVQERTGGKLDVLYNNGAFACPGAVEDLPRGALRAIFEVNLFGVDGDAPDHPGVVDGIDAQQRGRGRLVRAGHGCTGQGREQEGGDQEGGGSAGSARAAVGHGDSGSRVYR